MINWIAKHPRATIHHLGYIPQFLLESDPRPARKQFQERYIGSWNPFPGFTVLPNGDLAYPQDPPTALLFEAQFRNELIRVYEHAWVSITQPDGSVEISRMD